MKRNPFVMCFFLIGLLLLSNQSIAQTTTTESFDGTAFIPLGWSPVNSGSNYWSRNTVGASPTATPHSGAAMAGFNCVTTGNTTGAPAGLSQTISTPAFDLSGITANDTAHVSLWIYRNGSANTSYDSINIMMNTVQDTTGAVTLGTIARCRLISIPDTFLFTAWRQYTFDIPASFNGSTNYLMIRATSQAGNNIYIDDVSWESFPPACTGAPTAGSIAQSDTLICGGSGSATLVLNGSTTSASGISRQWKSGPSPSGPWADFGTGQLIESTGNLTASTYFYCLVTCTATGDADSTALAYIEVNPNPLPVIQLPTSPITICSGSGPVEIVASGADNYTWSPAGGLNTTTGDTVIASPTNTTTYTVVGTDAFGCSSSASITVQLRTTPNTNVQTNDSVICPGQTTNLFATTGGGPGGGNSYAWLPNGETTQMVTANPTTSSYYYCTVTNGFGCSRTDSIYIEVTGGVEANFGYSVNGRTVTFSDSSLNATNWSWSYGDGNGSTSQNPTYTFSADGSYNVTLIAGNGICNDDTIIITININLNGIATNDLNTLVSVNPNPVTDITNIRFTSADVKSILILRTMEGKILLQESIQAAAGEKQIQLNLKNQASGIYLLQISGETINGVTKLIKY